MMINQDTHSAVVRLLEAAGLEVADALSRLPSPDGVAFELIRLCGKDNATLLQIAQVVRGDPALAARLVRAANAPGLGRTRPVVAVRDAIMVLGVPLVRRLTLSFELVSKHRSGHCRGFDYQGFWARSLMIGLAAQMLAARLGIVAPEELFSCGLLANVGRLGLAALYPAEYAEVLETAPDPADLPRLERERFAADHEALTRAFLEDWGFPAPYVCAVAARLDPAGSNLGDTERPRRIADALHLAERVADACLAASGDQDTFVGPLFFDAARLGLDGPTLHALSERVLQDWHDWCQIFDLRPAAKPAAIGILAGDSPEGDTAKALPLALVVDDDPEILAALKQLLETEGYRVEVAANGRDGLRRAMKLLPRVIVTDWVMPEMDGLAMIRALRQSRAGRSMYVVALTALEKEDHLVEAFAAGADDYARKPIVPRVLAARLQAAKRIIGQQDESARDASEMRHITNQLAINNRKLQQAVLTDPLTGLHNHRHALERLEQLSLQASQSHGALACIVIDIDNLKAINAALGHDAGDAVLKAAAARLRDAVRPYETVFRFGGQEFLFLCQDTDAAAAADRAKTFRRLLSSPQIELQGIGVTVSLGVASVNPGQGAHEDLVALAESALHVAKTEGQRRAALPVKQVLPPLERSAASSRS